MTIADAEPLLAVLEESLTSKQLTFDVRVGFAPTPEGWRPVCKSKREAKSNADCALLDPRRVLRWRVWSNGEELGQVETEGWVDSNLYSKIGQLKITSMTVPRVGERSELFAGWDGTKKYRPLVALSEMSPRRSQVWSITVPSKADFHSIWPLFRRAVRYVEICRQNAKGDEIRKRVSVTPQHLEVFRVVRWGERESLIGGRIARHYLEECDGWPGQASDLWFYSDGRKTARLISRVPQSDEWPFSIEFLDIGDFDGDGAVEALFQYSGYNEDGYVLHSRGFTRTTSITWGYH